MESCPGHYGHITLNSPVYHAGMLTYIVKILKCICFNCSKVLACKMTPASTSAQAISDQKRFDNEKELESRDMLLKTKMGKSRFRKLLNLCASINVCESEKGGCGYR